MLMATTHLGTKNTDHQMRRYIFKRRADTSVNIIDLHKTWEKIQLAARVLVAIENPKVSGVWWCASLWWVEWKLSARS